MISSDSQQPALTTSRLIVRLVLVVFFVYLFMVAISTMGSGFKMMGAGVQARLITLTTNPFVGLFIGILTTAIVQSSSCTTSIVVTMVANNVLPLSLGIPIVMGANIGTSITSILVSLTHVTRKSEFRRAFAGAIAHDLFKVMTVTVLFPLELITHYLERAGLFLAGFLQTGLGMDKLAGPLDYVVKPIVAAVKGLLVTWCGLSTYVAGIIMGVFGLALIFISLTLLVKTIRGAVMARLERFFDRVLFRNAFIAFAVGLLATAFIQSSSITTSLAIPLLAAGVLTLEQVYPYYLGADIGTTVTSILAALALLGGAELGHLGLALALTHVLFNCTGAAVFYPLRAIPIGVARWYAALAAESKRYAFIFLVGVFFIVPGICIALFELLGKD